MFNFEYIGNIHIHSLHSDGGGDVSEIAEAASRAGLDFICLNDHEYMNESFHLDEEGFHEDVLVLIGLEIGKRYHHYLAYDIGGMIRGNGLSPQKVIDQVNEQGGFGFLAHPHEKGMPFTEKSLAYTWNDFSVTGYAGICLWNFSSRWKERIKTPFHGIFTLIFKSRSLKGPSKKTLAFWGEQCRKRRVAAIGGSDAHGALFRWGILRFRPLSYYYLLRTINIHIFLNKKMPKEVEGAKKEVYEAMKNGRLFIAHDKLCPARGFRFDFIADDGSDLIMGEEGVFQEGNLVVELPEGGEVNFIKDGKTVKNVRGTEAVYRVTEKGVYRVEVYRRILLFGLRPWIFSNPIYLR